MKSRKFTLKQRLLLVVAATFALCVLAGILLANSHPEPQRIESPIGNLLESSLTGKYDAKISFIQGLRLYYAYNPAAAFSEFKRAARADEHFAMAWWGMSISQGGNLNVPTVPKRLHIARIAAARARALSPYASPLEREYINALATRFGVQSENLREYAEAMRRVAAAHPLDIDANVLYSEALLERARGLGPTGVAEVQPAQSDDVSVALELLQTVFARTHHAAAAHLMIHAAEFAKRPERAVGAANWLYRQRLLSPESHLAHMSAHTFLDMGELKKASTASVKAVMMGESSVDALPSYDARSFYRDHNIDLALYSLFMSRDMTRAHTLSKNVSNSDAPIEIALYEGNDRLILRTSLARTLPSYFAHSIANARQGNSAEALNLVSLIRKKLYSSSVPDASLYSDFVAKSVAAELSLKFRDRTRARWSLAQAARARRLLPKAEVPVFFFYRLANK